MGLFKDEHKKDVRPIVISGSLRRLLTRAYTGGLKAKLRELTADHQLGVMRGGYEIGIHSARAWRERCLEKGLVMGKIDFRNAFNTTDRNLFVRLAAVLFPEIAPFLFDLYERETDLMADNGESITSSTGSQQGCGFSNFCFCLVVWYIHRELKPCGLTIDEWFLDDGFMVGTAEAVNAAIRKIMDLAKTTGLHLKLGEKGKCHVWCPSAEVYDSCSDSFADGVNVHPTMDDMEVLGAPIGSDSFVETQLDKKLVELEATVNAVAALPYKHEACSLLQHCASQCKVVHLLRTIPPRLTTPFARKFDRILRNGFEKLLGVPLEEKWWRLARLPARHGGFFMRSGYSTLGAQYTVSVVKKREQNKSVFRRCVGPGGDREAGLAGVARTSMFEEI